MQKIFLSMHRPVGSDVKESACNAGDLCLIPGSERSSGEGNGNPLQCSCLENSTDRETWPGESPDEVTLDMTRQLSLITWVWERERLCLWKKCKLTLGKKKQHPFRGESGQSTELLMSWKCTQWLSIKQLAYYCYIYLGVVLNEILLPSPDQRVILD